MTTPQAYWLVLWGRFKCRWIRRPRLAAPHVTRLPGGLVQAVLEQQHQTSDTVTRADWAVLILTLALLALEAAIVGVVVVGIVESAGLE